MISSCFQMKPTLEFNLDVNNIKNELKKLILEITKTIKLSVGLALLLNQLQY